MAEIKYGQPCPSKSPDGAACAWSRSHKNDHRDAASNGRCWTGGIRTAARWRCPRGFGSAPCGTCPTCMARLAAEPDATFWNGLPTVAERGTAIVAPAPQFPMYWARHLVGQRIAVVRVELAGVAYGGGTDYLDDVDGAGWRKVTKGKGGPGWPHSSVAIVDGSFQALKTTETGEADPALLLILLGGILGALLLAGVLAVAGVLG